MSEIVIDRKQGNGYDKILKENIDVALPTIMENVLTLDISESTEIPDDIQYTKERKTDVLKKVTDRGNNSFVLHLEWQSKNDKDMVYRMAEYAVMLYRKYHLPVEQHVIYVGKGVPHMTQTIEHKNFKFTCNIITLKKIDYKIFLNAKDPAIKVFSILCNFKKDGEENALENILKELKANTTGSLERNKYFNQLCVLVKLRNTKINIKFKK
jgi:hypothetical protein